MITRNHSSPSANPSCYSSLEEEFILDFDSYVNSMDVFDYCFN
jgi:hypothetical protein